MSLKTLAIVFGVVFVLLGVLGFIPGVTTDAANGHRELLGIFAVDTVHNIIHLASGIVALLCARNAMTARRYFQVFGVVYALVMVIGFIQVSSAGEPVELLGLFHVDHADNILHLVIAAVSLYAGFGMKNTDSSAPTTPSQPAA